MTHSVFMPIAGEIYNIEEDFNIKTGIGIYLEWASKHKLNKLDTEKEHLLSKDINSGELIITLPKGSKILFRNYESGRSSKVQVTHPGFKNFSSLKTKVD